MSIRITEDEMNEMMNRMDFTEICKYEDAFYFVYPNFYLRKRYNVNERCREAHVLMHVKDNVITEVEGEENIYDYLLQEKVSYIYLDMGIFKLRKYFERISGSNMFIDIFKGGEKILATSKQFNDYTPDKSFYSVLDERKELSCEESVLLKIWDSGTYPKILFQKNLLREQKYNTEENAWKSAMSQLRNQQLSHIHHNLYKNLWHILQN